MQKKHLKVMFYLLTVCIILALAALVFADDDNAANTLEAQKAALQLAAHNHFIKLDATIAVADNQTLNDTELVILKGNFNEVMGKIDSAKDKDELKQLQLQLVDIAHQFKLQAKSAAVDVYKNEVKKEIDKKAEKSKNETGEYKQRAAEARRTALLRLFDNHVEQAQQAIDRLKLRNVNTAAVEAKLGTFKSLKPDIVASLASNDKDQIREVMRKIQLNWNDLKAALREATRGKQITEALERADKMVERVQRNIDRLKEKGIATDVLQTKLDTLKTKISDARNALQLANYDAAEVILKQIKTAYIDLKQSHQDMLGKLGGNMAEKKFSDEDLKKSAMPGNASNAKEGKGMQDKGKSGKGDVK